MNTSEDKAQRLPQEFSKNGNNYCLHKRGDKAMIYAIVDTDGKEVDYEVFQIRTYPAGIRFGKQYPEREAFPPSEVFGRWAWHCNTEEKALRYFHGLENGEKVGHRNSREVPREEKL